MGSIIGSVVGAAGSIIGGQQSAKAAKQAAQIQAAAQDRAGERALTGYRYLTSGEGGEPMKAYTAAGQTALRNQGTTQNLMMDLLGITSYGNSLHPQAAPAPANDAPTTQPTRGYNAFADSNIPAVFHPEFASKYATGAIDAASGRPIYSQWTAAGQPINTTPPAAPVAGQPYAGPYPGPMPLPPNAFGAWTNGGNA